MSDEALDSLREKARAFPQLLDRAGELGPDARAAVLNQMAEEWSKEDLLAMAAVKLSDEELEAMLAEKKAAAKKPVKRKKKPEGK